MEEFKDIKGYEGIYQVSNEGRVWSVKNEIYMKPLDSHGYCRVALSKNRKQTKHLIHLLVYEASVGEIPEGMQVNHKDENRANNCLWNLELLTPKDNINYGDRNKKAGEKLSKQVYKYDLENNLIAIYPSVACAAKENKIKGSGICLSCNGGYYDKARGKWHNYNLYKGYKWSYTPL